MNKPIQDIMGDILSVIVHDLRNPTATLRANIYFIHEVLDSTGQNALSDEDWLEVKEALEDSEIAMNDLTQGLEQFAWIAQWFSNKVVIKANDSDLIAELNGFIKQNRQMQIGLQAPEGPLLIKGGSALPKLLNTLISNSVQHALSKSVQFVVENHDNEIVLEIRDDGPALAEELRDKAFTLEGQLVLREQKNGRYGRVLGLFAARTFADAIGVKLETEEREGMAVFRLRFKAAEHIGQ